MADMTHQQILEKAIQKAIDGGWKYDLGNGWANFGDEEWRAPRVDDNGDIRQYDGDDEWRTLPKETFIFNHDFAKALWGTKEHDSSPEGYEWEWNDCPNCKATQYDHYIDYCWQYHLQQMVIADDPIAYLGANL